MHIFKPRKCAALCIGVLVVLFTDSTALPARPAGSTERTGDRNRKVMHRTVQVDALEIFYREAGPEDAPTREVL